MVFSIDEISIEKESKNVFISKLFVFFFRFVKISYCGMHVWRMFVNILM